MTLQFNPAPYREPDEQSGSEIADMIARNLNQFGQTMQGVRQENRQAENDDLNRRIMIAGLGEKYGSVGTRKILRPGAPPRKILGQSRHVNLNQPMSVAPDQPISSFNMEDPGQMMEARQMYGSSGVQPYLDARKYGQENDDRLLARRKTESEIRENNAQAGRNPDAIRVQDKSEAATRESRRDIMQSKPYQEWQSVKTATDMLSEIAKDPSAMGSLSAVYSYIKVLDPTSVVREGEIKLLGEARGVGERLEGVINRLADGQVVNPSEVNELARWAQKKEVIMRKAAQMSNQPIVDQAKRRNLNLNEVNQDLFGSEPTGAPRFLKTATNPATGEKMGFDGQQWVPIQ